MEEAGRGFGEWLRARMAERHLSLAQLARAASCDYTYLWRMLNSETARGRRYRRPSYQMTCRIGEALGAVNEALVAAGYSPPDGAATARVADRLAHMERDLAALRQALQEEPSAAGPPVGLTAADWALRRVPLLGGITAGELTDSAELPDDWIEVPSFMAGGVDYALRVRGESMAPSLVDGELVLIRRQDHADPGQIVAAAAGAEITLKRLEMAGDVAYLVADNEDWARLRVDGSDPPVRILGVVMGSFRPAEVLRRRPR